MPIIHLGITTSRTAMETRQRCNRERFYGYHYEGTGLEKKGSKYDARFGEFVHRGLNFIVNEQMNPVVLENLCVELRQTINECFPDLDTDHMKREQTFLLCTLLEGWRTYRWPLIRQSYDVVTTEQEQEVVFMPGDYISQALITSLLPLRQPIRFDVVLRHRETGQLYIMDFKTASKSSDDWAVKLDNSLQSSLYTEAVKLLYPNDQLGGIWYEGLVKGKRELDQARSSPYQGQVIQYGSFCYGWRDKKGEVHKDYVSGRTRDQLFDLKLGDLEALGFEMRKFFPCTLPWVPLNSATVVAQQIMAENRFQHDLDMLATLPEGTRQEAEHIVFEQTLDNCYKFGNKHPCPFVDMCHKDIDDEEIKELYAPRIDHHAQEVEP